MNQHLFFDIVNGNPRTTDSMPDLFSFIKPKKDQTYKKPLSPLAKKIINHCLALHLHHKYFRNNKLYLGCLKIIANILLSVHFKALVYVKFSRNLGYDPDFKLGKFNNYIVGYFQSYKWFDEAKIELKSYLELVESKPSIKTLHELSTSENPVIVHVRLGDYRLENKLGIVNRSYYEEALNLVLRSGNFSSIWLFSDEPDVAINAVPHYLRSNLRVFNSNDYSPAETLEIMRFGYAYIIANSSFSWWGAFLSYTSNPPVYYPIPWFQKIRDPEDLIPDSWIGLNSDF